MLAAAPAGCAGPPPVSRLAFVTRTPGVVAIHFESLCLVVRGEAVRVERTGALD
jgi:hypothetical protein